MPHRWRAFGSQGCTSNIPLQPPHAASGRFPTRCFLRTISDRASACMKPPKPILRESGGNVAEFSVFRLRVPFHAEWSPVEAFWRCGQFASTGKVLTNPPEMGVGHRAVAAQQFLLVHASLCVVCILMLMQVLPLSVGASLGSYCQFGM